MKNHTKEQSGYLDKIDELLCSRNSKKAALKTLNSTLMQGLSLIKTFPTRWYVRDDGQDDFKKVISYLSKKYKKTIKRNNDCGIGELHGEFAFVPDDVDYSWEITQEEFNFLLGRLGKK